MQHSNTKHVYVIRGAIVDGQQSALVSRHIAHRGYRTIRKHIDESSMLSTGLTLKTINSKLYKFIFKSWRILFFYIIASALGIYKTSML